MNYQDFIRLVMDASEFASVDTYISDVGGSVPSSVSDDHVIPLLNACWAYSHDKSVSALRAITDMSRVELSRVYRIPLRSLENWESTTKANARSAPPYVLDLLAYAIITDMLI